VVFPADSIRQRFSMRCMHSEIVPKSTVFIDGAIKRVSAPCVVSYVRTLHFAWQMRVALICFQRSAGCTKR